MILQSMGLVDLPPELVIKILLQTRPADLIQCVTVSREIPCQTVDIDHRLAYSGHWRFAHDSFALQLCKYIFEIISGRSDLSYYTELGAAGRLDRYPPDGAPPFPERLRRLKRSEESWQSLDVSRYRKLTIRRAPGYQGLAGRCSASFHCVEGALICIWGVQDLHLESLSESLLLNQNIVGFSWISVLSEVDQQKDVLISFETISTSSWDWFKDLEPAFDIEHDLLILRTGHYESSSGAWSGVTWVLGSENILSSIPGLKCGLLSREHEDFLHIFSLSEGAAHPKAKQPHLRLPKNLLYCINMLLGDKFVILIAAEADVPDKMCRRMVVVNWRTGDWVRQQSFHSSTLCWLLSIAFRSSRFEAILFLIAYMPWCL
jgi:hypothetical protein